MKPAQRVGELRLHVDRDGAVWHYAPGQEAITSALDSSSFVKGSDLVVGAEAIHLSGVEENAPLICELHQRRCITKSPQVIRLGNPRWVPKNYKRVEAVFRRMEGMDLPASLGGWHRLTEKSYVTYALVRALKESGGKCTNLVERLLRAHPAWPALSFLTHLNKAKAAGLIVKILDPRWHVDPSHPDRDSRLKNYLGLGTGGVENMKAAVSGFSKGEKQENAHLVLETWTCGQYSLGPQDVVGAGNFLRQVQVEWVGRCNFKGLLKASHLFLRFLRDGWLDNLSEPVQYETVARRLGKRRVSTMTVRRLRQRKPGTYELFVPGHFFRQAEEIAAWDTHVSRLRGRSV